MNGFAAGVIDFGNFMETYGNRNRKYIYMHDFRCI